MKWGAAARRGFAEIRQGTMTRHSTAMVRKRDAVWSRNPPSPYGLGRHGAISVVGPPSRSLSYACGAPPRIWPRGAPNAARPTPSAGL